MKTNQNHRPKIKYSPVISFSLAPIKSHRSPISPRKSHSARTNTIPPQKSSRSLETSKKMRRRTIISLSFPSLTHRKKSLPSLKPFLCLPFSSHLQGKTVLSPVTGSSSTTPTSNPNETILSSKTISKTNPSKGSNQVTLRSSSTTTPKSAAPLSTGSNSLTSSSTSSTPT